MWIYIPFLLYSHLQFLSGICRLRYICIWVKFTWSICILPSNLTHTHQRKEASTTERHTTWPDNLDFYMPPHQMMVMRWWQRSSELTVWCPPSPSTGPPCPTLLPTTARWSTNTVLTPSRSCSSDYVSTSTTTEAAVAASFYCLCSFTSLPM